MLEIQNVCKNFNGIKALDSISFNLYESEILGLIGPNGAGKSTVLKTITGILPLWNGDIILNNVSIKQNLPSKNIALGLTFCPQGNRVFDELSLLDNLEIGGYLLSKKKLKEQIEFVLQIFPALKQRLKQNAGNLSGGEQQMLSLARALIPSPKFLLLDEPSLGLAPNLISKVFAKLVEINREYKISMLIVEQKVKEILSISDKVYSIKLGRIAYSGPPNEIKDNNAKLKELFLY
ncbi:MAG: ATP-binding cassette domain-containing protein [Candidatus Lokiarchaeota archaeon]|nr:ATP-binding cassette domain-containing protein [Candidatus Lokiarchaeota archaeon]